MELALPLVIPLLAWWLQRKRSWVESLPRCACPTSHNFPSPARSPPDVLTLVVIAFDAIPVIHTRFSCFVPCS